MILGLTFDPLMTFDPCSFVGPPDKDHAYIVCQAPLEGTVEDFWRMVWEQGTRTIVMVTGEMEQGKRACERSAVSSKLWGWGGDGFVLWGVGWRWVCIVGGGVEMGVYSHMAG